MNSANPKDTILIYAMNTISVEGIKMLSDILLSD